MPRYRLTQNPLRQLERSRRAIIKQRAALEDPKRPVSEIRKPYLMKTREFERRRAILERHEALFELALDATGWGAFKRRQN